jgi:hydroxymethylbilane synthase
VEIREDDARTRAAVTRLNDPAAADALTAERMVVRTLGGGCQMPIGAIAVCEGDGLHVRGAVIDPDTRRVVRNQVRGPRGDAAQLGEALARALLVGGAGEILDKVRRAQE